MDECGLEDVIEKVTEAVAKLDNPIGIVMEGTEIAWELFWNGAEITELVKDVISGNTYEKGTALGKITGMVTIDPLQYSEASDFISGFIHGYTG